MQTKSIDLTDEEAAELRKYSEASGEGEAAALKQAALRGLREMRLEQAFRAYREGRGSSDAAEIAGLPRAIFLQLLIEHGESLIDEDPPLADQLGTLAKAFGDERLASAARKLRWENSESPPE